MSETEFSIRPARYHRGAIVLHWLLALLLAYQFALGLRLEDKAAPAQVFTAFQLHKSVGITILLLSLARLALRLVKPRPAEIGSETERLAARLTHGAFYAIMLLGPLSGWIIVSTARIKVPTVLFGLVPWPHLPLAAGARDPAELAHGALVWALPALVALHVAAVFYHLRLRDGVPQRMLPSTVAVGSGLAAALVSLAVAVGLGLAGPLPALWSSLTGPAPAQRPELAPATLETDVSDIAPDATAEPTETASEPAAATDAALSCNWTLAPGSRLGFTANYSGEPVAGSFRDWTAQIVFCEDNPAAASISASIALASADTADSSRDENLKGPSFFDAAAFPRARFTARGFKPLGGGRYTADGTLSLRGKSHPVRLTFTIKIAGDKASAQGSARLSRLAFGIGTDEWAATDQIADAVAVSFTIAARRKPE